MIATLTKSVKLEFLKFRRFKPFWIIIGLFVLVFFAVGFSVKTLLDYFMEQNDEVAEFFQNTGIPIFDFVDIWQNFGYITFLFKVVLAFVVIISICLEFNYKTIRQNMIDGLSRREYVISKLSLVATLSLLSGALLFLLGLSLGLIYSQVKSPDFIFMNIQFVGAYMLEVFSFLCFAMFLSTLIRRTGFAIVLFILYSLIMEPIATAIMEFEYKLPVWYFPIEAINNLIRVPFPKYVLNEVQDFVAFQDVAVVVGWTAVFIWLTYLLIKKRDI